MTGRICSTCVHWDQAGSPLSRAAVDPQAQPALGACCVDPPRLTPLGPFWSEGVFPITHATRFCAEWSPAHVTDPDDGERQPVEPVANVLAFERPAA